MEEKLFRLYKQCLIELNNIGIDMENKEIGKIEISINNRKTSNYGVCIQKNPCIESFKLSKSNNKIVARCNKFKNHHIKISSWVMNLNDDVIKNTIMHELIHCIDGCNNHGKKFKYYASYINEKLGYNITRTGDKKKDFLDSNKDYSEEYKYKITCMGCKAIFYRKRLTKNFIKKYRCAKCGESFKITTLN